MLLRAQQPIGHVFRLSADQTERVFRDKSEERLDSSYYAHWVDSFSVGTPIRSLSPGHYLAVSAAGNVLDVEIFSHNTLSINILAVHGGFACTVRDSSGALRGDARLSLSGKNVPYDSTLRCYLLPRRAKGGLLRVELAGETLFQEITVDDKRPLWWRKIAHGSQQGFGKALCAPFRRAWRGLGQIGGNNYSRRRLPQEMPGYLAFSQPTYRPGDTLRAKAYLADRKNRPWKGPVLLELRSHPKAQPLLRDTLRPTSPGNFDWTWPLPDSLGLDQHYSLHFIARGCGDAVFCRKKLARWGMFGYEDYQLDELDWVLTAPRTGTILKGDSVRLTLRARDATGNPVADGKAHLLLLPGNIGALYAPEARVPDTLFQTRLWLDERGTAVLAVPTEHWPAVQMPVTVHAFCSNSAGELQERSAHFLFENNPKSPSKPTNNQAFVPFPEVSVEGRRSGDSVFFAVRNPKGLPLHYEILRGRGIVAQGCRLDTAWQWHSPEGRAPFEMHHYFSDGKRTFQQTEELPWSAQHLDIAVQQPAVVEPGALVQVKIRVRDAQQRPVEGASLSAGAYNSRFQQQPYEASQPRWQDKGSPFRYNDFSARRPYHRFRQPLTPDWYQRLQLQRSLEHRLRFAPRQHPHYYAEAQDIPGTQPPQKLPPSLGFVPNADSLYPQMPQFSAYVLDKNGFQPVYLLYCNAQLLYCYASADRPPYSFFGRPGYNQITLRTRDASYHLDSVFLEKGKKLNLVLDLRGLPKGQMPTLPKPLRLRHTAQPDELSEAERRLLRATMFQWNSPRHDNYFLWQGPDNIHHNRGHVYGQKQLVGPFPAGSTLQLPTTDKPVASFRFEGGFRYDIAPGRERLYASDWPTEKTKLPLLPAPAVGQLALRPADVEAPLLLPKGLRLQHPSFQAKPGSASLQFVFAGPGPRLHLWALRNADTTLGPFSGHAQQMRSILPGNYQFLLFNGRGEVLERSFHLGRDTLLLADLSALAFRAALPGEVPDSLFRGQLAALVSPPKPTPRPSGGWPGWDETRLSGTVTDGAGEPLIGASIRVLDARGEQVALCRTDVEGHYGCTIASGGAYRVEIRYLGYQNLLLDAVQVMEGQRNVADAILRETVELREVVVMATGSGKVKNELRTLSGEDIRRLPTRSVNATLGDLSGVQIRGGRSDSEAFYLDGIQVGGEFPVLEAPQGLRSSFRDHAYWQPNLRSDAAGESYFQVKIPDDLGTWEHYVLGMDKKGRMGSLAGEFRADKSLSARLALPRFALPGDRFELLGLVRNRAKDSLLVRTRFRSGDLVLAERNSAIGAALQESQSVEVPQGADSLRFVYEVLSAGSTDGEERALPILPLGSLESIGQYWALERDTQFQIPFDTARGPLWFRAQNNTLDLLLDDVDFLLHYPYDCNEQLASRLLGLLAEASIRQKQGQAFKREKLLQKTLKTLKNNQLPDGAWAWWGRGSANNWMSIYVLRSLHAAQKAGHGVRREWEQGLIWLRNHLAECSLEEQSEALLLLREAGLQVPVAPLLARLDSLPKTSAHLRLKALRLRQLEGQNLQRDSLLRLLQPTALGGLSALGRDYDWYDRPRPNSALAHDIATAAGWPDIAAAIRRHWLQHRPAAAQRHTVETAQILERLWPHIAASGTDVGINILKINGLDMLMDGRPQALSLAPGRGAVSLQKTGPGPLYCTAYQQWQNPAPQPNGTLFGLRTRLEQGSQPVEALRRAERADLVLELQVKQRASYVRIEVPIPAGCSYAAEAQSASPAETHREQFRDRTVIFCEDLPVGRYLFRIPLEARFSGRFTLNPARAEHLYFPTLSGQNGMGVVKVEK
jgi:hypothetical protein